MGLFGGPPDVEKLKAKQDVKGLVKALGYVKDSDVCQAAVEALAEIGPPAVEPLIAALEDSGSRMRADAAEALGKLGDPRAVEPLRGALAVECDGDACGSMDAALEQLGVAPCDD
jgi:HEAT repeat protein